MAAADYQWKLEPHVCALCLGRVASRLVTEKRVRRPQLKQATATLDLFDPDAPKATVSVGFKAEAVDVTRKEFRCTVCANTWPGEVKGGCACGVKLGGRDGGIRCVANPNPRPEMPAEFIAKEIP